MKNFRKDNIVELYNEGRPARPGLQGLSLLGLGIQALPVLDANGSTVAIESIELENEGWERDIEVTEPVEFS